DFGPGLDDEGIAEIFASYGESTKRNDQKQTGTLGIGCKSGFAYGDSFIVNSYKDGKITSWNAYIDPSQQGKMAKMVTVETTEPNGIEIVIPVKGADISRFHEKALKFFTYFSVLPKFQNLEAHQLKALEDLRNRTAQFQGKGWKFFGSGLSMAIMGNIAYPINANVFTDAELTPNVRQILGYGLEVEFKLGQLEFAASREAIQYTPHTKKNLVHRLNEVADEIVKEASSTFNNCKTRWDARALWAQVFNYGAKCYQIRNLFHKQLTFNGQPLNTDKFNARSKNWGDVQCGVYLKNPGSRIRRQDISEITAHPSHFVVVNDSDICNGIINRLAPIIEDGPKYERVYLLKFKDDNAKADWIKETSYDGPMVSLKSLPKESLTKYYGHLMAT